VEAWLESETGVEHYVRIGQPGLMSNLANEARLLSQLRHSALDHLVYVEVDGELRAVAAVNERLRASAVDALSRLEQQGVQCEIMTGDRAERARQLLERTRRSAVPHPPGLQPQLPTLNQLPVQGGLSPEEKATRVSELVAAGHRVGFVGDGINDAPAMQEASLGIALASGAGVTTAGANVVLHGGDLRALAWAVALARRVRGAIRSNLMFAAAYNSVGMGLAAAGLLHPVASALLMVVSSFTVSWRALRSIEVGEDCCVVSRPMGPTQLASQTALARSRSQLVSAWLVVAQAPFLVYLGHTRGVAAGIIWAALTGLGLVVARYRARDADWARWGRMTIAMLGLGNWGMLLGWWADAGLGPIKGSPLCCVASGFSLWGFCQMPWMNLGMLALGLPPMLVGPSARVPGLNRFALGALSAVGMIWGMSFGDYVAMKWLAPLTSERVFVCWLGMTAGMLAGMLLACEFGRALALARTNGSRK
jgi:phosphoserine phosphatase